MLQGDIGTAAIGITGFQNGCVAIVLVFAPLSEGSNVVESVVVDAFGFVSPTTAGITALSHLLVVRWRKDFVDAYSHSGSRKSSDDDGGRSHD